MSKTEPVGSPMPKDGCRATHASAVSRRVLAASIAVVGILLMTSFGFGIFAPSASSGHLSSPTAKVDPTHSAAALSATASAAAKVAPSKSSAAVQPAVAPSSGRGVFFVNNPIPMPSATPGLVTCAISWWCVNDTNSPSANLTTAGYAGMAYTAYTNDSPCAGMRGNTTVPDAATEIGFVNSTDFGTTWSSPIYIGNPVCTGDGANYASAIDPTLTSLPNGTFVMAYIQYNLSTQYMYSSGTPLEEMDCYYIYYDRLVVTSSYDNGTTWSTPVVVDQVNRTGCPTAGFMDLRPSITALGNDVYVSWMNVSGPIQSGIGSYPSSEVKVSKSMDGGQTWSAAQALPFAAGYWQYYGSTYVAMNPNVLVLPSGEVFIAYATAFSYSYVCTSTCVYSYSSSIYVSNSTDGGATWTTSDVSDGVMPLPYLLYPLSYVDPAPVLAYSAFDGQVFLAYAANAPGNFCANYGYGVYCGSYYNAESIFLQNSSDLGATWSAARDVLGTNLINPNGGFTNSAYNPSIAVDVLGRLHLQYSFMNNSGCVAGPYGQNLCVNVQELYQNSTDDGFTWTTPVSVYPVVTYFDDPSRYFYVPYWQGTSTSIIAAGTGVLLAWTTSQCPSYTTTYCSTGNSGGAQVVASQLFEGTGITLTFSEVGLPSTTSWLVNVQDNWRSGPAGSSLSVSGVPTGTSIAFYAPWVNISYGDTFTAVSSVVPPSSFLASTTVTETFSEQLLLNIQTVPAFDYYTWAYAYVNWAMNPYPGAYWYSAGSTVSLSVSPTTWGSCYYCTNATFLSWTGIGSASANSTSSTVSLTMNGPINETANFNIIGICVNPSYYYGGGGCVNYTYPMVFQESGLPAGTAWSITYVNQTTGELDTVTATTSNITIQVSTGALQYYLWSVPSATAGTIWLPTSSSTDPASIPGASYVHISYALGLSSSSEFPTVFQADGLPNTTSWSLELNGMSYGVGPTGTSIGLSGSGMNSVNGSYVYLPNSTGFYVSSVTVEPFVQNESSFNLGLPNSFGLNGSALVTLHYSPRFYVTVTPSVGGSIDKSSQWVNQGSSATFTETPASGYYFVGWTGQGGGSLTATTTSVTVHPTSPVTELATFRPIPAVTWNVTLMPLGLPAGANYTVGLGAVTYSGWGAITIGNLVGGPYNLSTPTVSLNASNTTRFVASSVTSDLTISSGVLNVNANGTVTIEYTTQYTVLVASTSGGTVSPSAGSHWYDAATPVVITATPARGHYFDGWNGTGPGSITTAALTGLSGTLTVNGPISETAIFIQRQPAPPATYWLQVTQTGLSPTTAWSVSAGTYGATGVGGTLTVMGLNGSYNLIVPMVYGPSGSRFVANATNVSLSVLQNGTFTVAFSPEFLVTIVAPDGGGSVSPTTSWVAQSGMVSLSAVANASSDFVSWNGTGPGNYTGTSPTASVTVSGAITEKAVFAPKPVQGPNSVTSSLGGLTTALILLVVLAAVGALVGILLGRRGGPKSPEPMEAYNAPPASEELYGEGGSAEAAGAPPPLAEYDEGPVTN